MVDPKKAETMAGGASLAPKRCSFPAEAIEARNKSARSFTAFMILTKKDKKRRFSFGLDDGANKLMPESVAKAQLLCFPLPFIPANGFSWNSTFNLCLDATLDIKSINSALWSQAKLASSKVGATSNWAGATSLWRVRTGMPNFNASISKSTINEFTRVGMEPK